MEEYQPSEIREDTKPPQREVCYAIGVKHKNKDGVEYGMWRGPSPNETDMLEVVGRNSRDRIIRFNEDGTDTELWRWKKDRWIKICK